MSVRKLHSGEADIDESLVRRLLNEQFPEWAELPLEEVRSTGTVNVIFRLGDGMYVRLPRGEEWAEDLDKELRWLPELAPHLTLRIPEPLGVGVPTEDYPLSWAVFRWLSGQTYSDGLIADEQRAARDLADFVTELRRIKPVKSAPRAGRAPLGELDAMTREAISASHAVIDSDAATVAWERALKSPTWAGDPVWIHADLMRPNVLVRGGRICAVLDFGSCGIGDSASDVIPAWEVFGEVGRDEFRDALGVDDGTWERAKGFALHQAAMIIPYYRETNPEFVALAKVTVEQILSENATNT